jgi:ABC-type nitrate/sulfonate/bicarbonate transport system ATPase subunit
VVRRLAIDLPRPRNRTDAECNALRREVLPLLKEQQDDSLLHLGATDAN